MIPEPTTVASKKAVPTASLANFRLMLAELREDNARLADRMRETHNVCEEHRDVATTSLLEVWIDEAERRAWFLFEASRPGETPGR